MRRRRLHRPHPPLRRRHCSPPCSGGQGSPAAPATPHPARAGPLSDGSWLTAGARWTCPPLDATSGHAHPQPPRPMDMPSPPCLRWTCPPATPATNGHGQPSLPALDMPTRNPLDRWTCPPPDAGVGHLCAMLITATHRGTCPVVNRRSEGHVQWRLGAVHGHSAKAKHRNTVLGEVKDCGARTHEFGNSSGSRRRQTACSALPGPS